VKGDREQRRVVLRRLLAVKAELGEVPNSAVDAAAHMLGLSVRQVRRLVATGGDADPVEAFDLTKQMIDHLFAARGNALKAHERLIAAHVDLPVGPRQFQRAVEQHVDQALRAAAKRGLDGFIASTVYLGGPVAHRNEIWAIDHTPAPVAVRPRTRGLAPYIPWTTTLMDKGTGAWMAGTVKDSDPNAADTIATLGRGVAGFTLRDGTFAGGLPDVLLSDRGGDLISDPATIGLTRVLVNRRYTEPGSPWQNGKVERLQGLWQSDWCTSLPGYLFGDRFSYQRKLNLAMSNPENLLFEDQFAALFAKEIERRNEEHVSNGRTAAQRWAADTTPLRLAEPEVIRLAMLRDETRIVHKGTIEFRGHLYVAPELKTRSKTKVDIRYMPGSHQHRGVLPRQAPVPGPASRGTHAGAARQDHGRTEGAEGAFPGAPRAGRPNQRRNRPSVAARDGLRRGRLARPGHRSPRRARRTGDGDTWSGRHAGRPPEPAGRRRDRQAAGSHR